MNILYLASYCLFKPHPKQIIWLYVYKEKGQTTPDSTPLILILSYHSIYFPEFQHQLIGGGFFETQTIFKNVVGKCSPLNISFA